MRELIRPLVQRTPMNGLIARQALERAECYQTGSAAFVKLARSIHGRAVGMRPQSRRTVPSVQSTGNKISGLI
ncbi:MAG TPA: hypothetical protein VH186_04840 [Chloroflexia bacterium]|nr:hypothetical protein [Chloroflexia bacterium]